MSSYPSRLAKRAMKTRGYVRQWIKIKGDDSGRTWPHRVLDEEGNSVADTWGQAAVHASRADREGLPK